MKKLLKTLAVVLAFVLAVDAPVASTVSAAGTVAGTAAVSSVPEVLMGTGDDDGTGSGKKDPVGTNMGDDTTWDGADQVLAVVIEGDRTQTVEKGDYLTLTANVVTNNKCDYDLDWTIEGDNLVENGNAGGYFEVEALYGGSAKVTVTATSRFGSKSDSVTVNVKEYADKISFERTEYSGELDTRFSEKHKVDMSEELVKDPVTATDTITYSVDNKNVATVDAKGVVTFKKKGKVVLTAVSEKGAMAQTTINVAEGNPVKKITIQQVVDGTKTDIANKKLTLADYEAKAELVVVVEGKDSSKPVTDELTWTSAKPAIVELVDGVSNGKTQTLLTDLDDSAEIQACGVGTSKITVKASSGKSASITVTAQAPTKTLKFVDEDGEEVTEGETYPLKKFTLQLERDPKVSKDKIEWSSSNKAKVAVSGKKNDTAQVTVKLKEVDPTKTETFTITAKVKDTDVKAEYVLTVNPSQITDIKAADNMKTVLSVGEQTRYAVQVEGMGSKEEITWSSSNAKVLSVDKNGRATALKAGKANVKASVTTVGKKTKTVSYKVTVTQPITSISMKKDLITVAAGKQKKVSLTAVLAPKGAKKEQITYTIMSWSNCPGATINNNKVTVPASAKPGNIIGVEARVKDSDITAYATIQVIGKKPKFDFNNDKIKSNKLTIYVGDKEWLRPSLTHTVDEPFWFDPITYSVSKKGIVSVDGSGYVTALQPGTVTVTAKTLSGAKKTVKVTVQQKPVESEAGTGDTGSGDKK